VKETARTIFAFLARDARLAVSYRLDFGLRLLSVLLTVLVLFFISRLVGEKPEFASFQGYLPFAAIGLALMSYFQTGFRGFSGAIRNEQVMGTLEALLMTPAKLSTIVVASSAWSFFWATLTSAIVIIFSSVLYDIHLQGNLFLAALVLFLTFLIFASLGVISASFIMVFKRGDPLGFLFGTVSMLLGGVFYPVEDLPSWLRKVSMALPITHGLSALRAVLLQGEPLDEILPQLLILFCFAAVGIPLSFFCLKRAVLRARAEGTLVQY